MKHPKHSYRWFLYNLLLFSFLLWFRHCLVPSFMKLQAWHLPNLSVPKEKEKVKSLTPESSGKGTSVVEGKSMFRVSVCMYSWKRKKCNDTIEEKKTITLHKGKQGESEGIIIIPQAASVAYSTSAETLSAIFRRVHLWGVMNDHSHPSTRNGEGKVRLKRTKIFPSQIEWGAAYLYAHSSTSMTVVSYQQFINMICVPKYKLVHERFICYAQHSNPIWLLLQQALRLQNLYNLVSGNDPVLQAECQDDRPLNQRCLL